VQKLGKEDYITLENLMEKVPDPNSTRPTGRGDRLAL